jgi:putative transposase
VRYALIDEHRDHWPVAVRCDVLAVSRTGDYARRNRSPRITAQRQAVLTEKTQQVDEASRAKYGALRVHAELMANGQVGNRKTVAKCMKQSGICAKSHP